LLLNQSPEKESNDKNEVDAGVAETKVKPGAPWVIAAGGLILKQG
jgi:hypothetical protein